MTSRSFALAFLAGCLASPPALAQDTTVAMGKQFAAASPLEWEVQEASHPTLGKIRFAYVKNLVETPVGNAKVYSRAYISCDPTRKKIAIELTNTTSPDDPGGLRPKSMPRLVCSRLAKPTDTTPIREELLAPRWEANKIGDVLAHSLTAFPLRECVSIEVQQEVELPKGWAQPSTAVNFEITPYTREVDQIFATCGEVSAYPAPPTAIAKAPEKAAPAKSVPAPTPARAAPPPAPPPAPKVEAPKPAPPVAPPKPVQGTEGFRQARVASNAKTNVRAGPSLNSAVVMSLDPGMPVVAQKAEADWWHIKTVVGGKPVEGYIRQDRLVFK